MLTCDCGFDFEYWYFPDDDFTIYNKNRWKRCHSCKEFITNGNLCLRFTNFRESSDDIEERIYPDGVPLADCFMCERCGEIFLNLEALEYCINIAEPMQELLEEYWEITGFKPEKEENEI